MNVMECGQGKISRAFAISGIRIKNGGMKASLSYAYGIAAAATDKLAQEVDVLLKPDNQ